jgi:hypothetical protein
MSIILFLNTCHHGSTSRWSHHPRPSMPCHIASVAPLQGLPPPSSLSSIIAAQNPAIYPTEELVCCIPVPTSHRRPASSHRLIASGAACRPCIRVHPTSCDIGKPPILSPVHAALPSCRRPGAPLPSHPASSIESPPWPHAEVPTKHRHNSVAQHACDTCQRERAIMHGQPRGTWPARAFGRCGRGSQSPGEVGHGQIWPTRQIRSLTFFFFQKLVQTPENHPKFK